MTAAERPTVDRYFMDMTHLVKRRGTCPRRQVGAVIVKDKHVLTTGYNGAPKGFPHPSDIGCIRDELAIPSGMMADVCPCLHAEQNAIIQAATFGVSVSGADLYCTTQPCTQCSRMIANSGIRRVIFQEEYADPLAIGLLTTAGVELYLWNDEAGTAHPYGKTNTWEEAQDDLRRRWDKDPILPPEGQQREAMASVLPSGRAATEEAIVKATPTAGEETEPRNTSNAGIRDLSSAPDREAFIRRMAEEHVKRLRRTKQE